MKITFNVVLKSCTLPKQSVPLTHSLFMNLPLYKFGKYESYSRDFSMTAYVLCVSLLWPSVVQTNHFHISTIENSPNIAPKVESKLNGILLMVMFLLWHTTTKYYHSNTIDDKNVGHILNTASLKNFDIITKQPSLMTTHSEHLKETFGITQVVSKHSMDTYFNWHCEDNYRIL